MRKNQIYNGCIVKLKNDSNFYTIYVNLNINRPKYTIQKIFTRLDIEHIVANIQTDCITTETVYIKARDIEKIYTFSDYARLIQNENK